MIVSIGEPMVEFNQTGEKTFLQGFGGDSSNMVIAAARSGARTAYVTRVGDDEFGRMLLALWKREGVDTSAVIVDPQEPRDTRFKAAATAVTVDVVVRDQRGYPVTDLREADFQLLEDGVLQDIRDFTLV